MAGAVRVVDQRGVLLGVWRERDARRTVQRGRGRWIPVRHAAKLAARTAAKLQRSGHPAAEWMSLVAQDFRTSAKLFPRELVLQLPVATDVERRSQQLTRHDAVRDLLGLVATGHEKPSAHGLRVAGSPVPPEAWAHIHRQLRRAERRLERRVMWREARRPYADRYPIDY